MKVVGWARTLIVLLCVYDASCTGHISEPGGGPPQAVPPCVGNPTQLNLAFLNSGKRNGEFSLASDPRSTTAQGGNQFVYAAGQELTLGNSPFPACIIAKKTVVYFSDQNGRIGTWKPAVGNQDLPGANNPKAANPRSQLPQSRVWATDEVIRVASDGTVYLTLLDTAADTSCTPQFDFQHAPFSQVRDLRLTARRHRVQVPRRKGGQRPRRNAPRRRARVLRPAPARREPVGSHAGGRLLLVDLARRGEHARRGVHGAQGGRRHVESALAVPDELPQRRQQHRFRHPRPPLRRDAAARPHGDAVLARR